jgi:hypothetical protein
MMLSSEERCRTANSVLRQALLSFSMAIMMFQHTAAIRNAAQGGAKRTH